MCVLGLFPFIIPIHCCKWMGVFGFVLWSSPCLVWLLKVRLVAVFFFFVCSFAFSPVSWRRVRQGKKNCAASWMQEMHWYLYILYIYYIYVCFINIHGSLLWIVLTWWWWWFGGGTCHDAYQVCVLFHHLFFLSCRKQGTLSWRGKTCIAITLFNESTPSGDPGLDTQPRTKTSTGDFSLSLSLTHTHTHRVLRTTCFPDDFCLSCLLSCASDTNIWVWVLPRFFGNEQPGSTLIGVIPTRDRSRCCVLVVCVIVIHVLG